MKTRKLIIFMLVIMTVLLLVSCIDNQQNENEQVTNQPIEHGETDTISSSFANAKGEVITTDKVENEEGGYFIPIPESWFGKVSYELDGTHTYIYHITQDENELEINPVILHIDATTDIDPNTTGINIFMELGEMKFYEVLRRDAPYTEGSKDLEEFMEIYEEVESVLLCVWVLDESKWQEYISPTSSYAFTCTDAYIGNIIIGRTSKDAALAAIGEEPISINEE